MKILRVFAVIVFAHALAASAFAQPLTPPEIHSDRTITFRFTAPNAREVKLYFEALPGPQSLKNDQQGVWSFTTEPVAPDIYIYSYVVDGLHVPDPANPKIKYSLFASENQLFVPGAKPQVWEITDVPHGIIHRHHYRSTIIGEERDVWVYTPPGYDATAAQKLPVLYLLHGFSDTEDTWVTVGRANVILDNLIARGTAKPMLIVMPRGYGNRELTSSGFAIFNNSGWRQPWDNNNDKFGQSLLNEIIPLVERNYNVAPDRTSCAIAGLSMGGTQALLIGLGAPDRFAWIASFSEGGGMPENLNQRLPGVNEKLNDQLRLLWLGCGSDDSLFNDNKRDSAWLKARGVHHIWEETPGRHNFLVWRRYLAHVLPMLFQEASSQPIPGPKTTGQN